MYYTYNHIQDSYNQKLCQIFPAQIAIYGSDHEDFILFQPVSAHQVLLIHQITEHGAPAEPANQESDSNLT